LGIETSIHRSGSIHGRNQSLCPCWNRQRIQLAQRKYEIGPIKGFADEVLKGFSSIVPPEADVSAVAEAIVRVVDTPFGKRHFAFTSTLLRTVAEVVNMVSDRVRASCCDGSDSVICLTPRVLTTKSQNAA